LSASRNLKLEADTPEALSHDKEELGESESTDEQLAAMMDEFSPPNDGMMDHAEMMAAAEEMEAMLEYIGEESQNVPLLDLSVLDKPLPSNKNIDRH
jgi:hypothetical protein